MLAPAKWPITKKKKWKENTEENKVHSRVKPIPAPLTIWTSLMNFYISILNNIELQGSGCHNEGGKI